MSRAPRQHPPDTRSYIGLWQAAGLMLAVFTLYWNVLPAPFVFDDERAIVVNERIRLVSTSFSGAEAGSPFAGRPLVSATFALNYAAGGLDVRGYRLVNIALHGLCAVLLLALLTQVQFPPRAALAAAAIWMVHPLVTEAVNYVSQRTELLMALFFLLTLYASQRAGREREQHEARWLRVSVICCALGMACKETMAVAPVAVLLFDRTFLFGSFGVALRRRRLYYLALCGTWVVLAALLASSPRGDSAGFADAAVTPWEYLLNQSRMIAQYLKLTVWPRRLVLDYGEPAALTLPDVLPFAIGVAALLAGAVVALIRWPRVGLAAACFFLTLAPTSSVIPISTEVGAERRMYLPLMALVSMGVALVWNMLEPRTLAPTLAPSHPRTLGRTFAPLRTLAPSHLVVLLVIPVLAITTVHRNSEYLSGLTLWQSVLDRWPDHARAHRNLAAELKLAGRLNEEIDHLRAAARDLPGIRHMLGLELLSLGRHDEAIEELSHFVRDYPRDPNVSDALSNLGIALSARGRLQEATDAFTRAVTVDPHNGLSQRNLALHLLDQNDFDGAVRHGQEAVRLTPDDASAHSLLGLALVGQQRLDEAIVQFQASLALQPTNNEATGYLERTRRALAR